jgi:PAS domain S-box-containing protein
MTIKQSIRNIIVGKEQYIASHGVYKSTILRGHIAILTFVVSVVYLVADLFYAGMAMNLAHVALVLVSFLSFIFNRSGKYFFSNATILLILNISIYLFASRYPEQSGLYFFFITNGLFALGLFGYQQKYWGLAFALFSLGLFLLTHLTDFAPLGKAAALEISDVDNFAINFTLAFITSTLLLFFMIDVNHHSEKSLKENELSLIYTTEELKKSRRRFEMAVKGSKAGIYEWDKPTDRIFVSAYYKELLGYDENELNIGGFDDYREFVHPDDKALVEASMAKHFETREPYQTEVRLRMKCGDYKWFADSGVSLIENGEVVMVVGSIIDITERKNAEEKILLQNELLAKTNSELDRFVYSTSHDLRAPLSSMLGLITIAERTEDPEEVVTCLKMMKARIVTLEVFIKEIIDYSRNSRLGIKQETVRLYPLVQEIVENLRFTEGAENIFVRYNISPDLNIVTDEARLKVIINNLIGNSIKYSDISKENPFISIDASKNEERVLIMIEDNGIGIDQVHQPKIFDMFYRASEKSDGSGLGLYIVKETIEKLSGKVEVDSARGKGTTFLIHLPLRIV